MHHHLTACRVAACCLPCTALRDLQSDAKGDRKREGGEQASRQVRCCVLLLLLLLMLMLQMVLMLLLLMPWMAGRGGMQKDSHSDTSLEERQAAGTHVRVQGKKRDREGFTQQVSIVWIPDTAAKALFYPGLSHGP